MKRKEAGRDSSFRVQPSSLSLAAGREKRIPKVLDSIEFDGILNCVWDESPSVSSRGFQPRTQSLFSSRELDLPYRMRALLTRRITGLIYTCINSRPCYAMAANYHPEVALQPPVTLLKED